MFMYEPETATLHLKVFLSDRRRLTVVSKLEKLFFVLNVSVIACLMGQALQSSPLPQPLFRELTQLSSSPTLLAYRLIMFIMMAKSIFIQPKADIR